MSTVLLKLSSTVLGLGMLSVAVVGPGGNAAAAPKAENPSASRHSVVTPTTSGHLPLTGEVATPSTEVSRGGYTWRTGTSYRMPVVLFNKAETHSMAGNVGVVSALAAFLPPPFNLYVAVNAAVVAKTAADAEDRKKCLLVHFNGVPSWYSGGYCR